MKKFAALLLAMLMVIYDTIRRQRYVNRENKKTAELQAELERLRKLAGEE